MKKYLVIAFMLFGITSVNAAGVSMGISAMGGLFEVDGAKEEFKGAHSSNSSPGNVTKNASSDGDEAEGLFAVGSVFMEINDIADRGISIGVDYVPHSLESETTENIQNIDPGYSGHDAESKNTVQIDFKNLITVYGTVPINENMYAKLGYVTVDVDTNEKLATGGSYGNTDLSGYTIGLGYSVDRGDGAFIRLEASYMDLDGATLKNTVDTTKSVTADGITGYGAKVSVGKSF